MATSITMATAGCTKTRGTVQGDLKQPSAYEQTSRVVCVDQAPDSAREQQQRDDPPGEQYADLVWPGAVSLQAEGQGHQRHLVAERRNDPSGEGDVQVSVVAVNVQHLLNSIR